MKIGIIGLGIIGSALEYSFEKIGHSIRKHDIKLKTKIDDVLDSDIIYICVPTPSLNNGECDTSIVEKTIDNLMSLKFANVIAIKSTVEPGFTQKIIDKYKNDNICFVPEFLRERCAIGDFMENHDLLAIGSQNDMVAQIIIKNHGKFPKNVKIMSPTEAELLKYYSNTLNALKIVFANEMFEICMALNSNYNEIKDAYILRNVNDMYLDVNVNFRGYGGVCLPKDVKALNALCKKLNLNLKLFETIDTENKKFKTTVFDNMRKQ